MFNSGVILFNDPVSIYLNKVADNLLRNDRDTRSKIRIYTVRSGEVNAFTTNNGSIFLNLGLLAQCSNEAQIAFIIGHEITHFKKKHSLKDILLEDQIKSKKGEFRKSSKIKTLLKKSAYSKDQEFEADQGGLEILMNSPYQNSNIENTFDILKYSYLPFEDIPFDKSFFETSTLKFPKSYHLEKVNAIGAYGKQNDSKTNDENDLSTHPSCEKRKEVISQQIMGKTNNGSLFIQPQDTFFKIRDIARFETIALEFFDNSYTTSIYEAYVMLKKYPDNLFLLKFISMNLIKIGEYHLFKIHIRKSGRDPADEGEIQRLKHLFSKLESNEKEFYITTTCFIQEALNKYPEDVDLLRMRKKILIIQQKDLKNDEFVRTPLAENIRLKDETINSMDSTSIDKYQKIKLTELIKNSDTTETEDYWKFAYSTYLNDNNFLKDFATTKKSISSEKETKKLIVLNSSKGCGVQDSIFIMPPNYEHYYIANRSSKNKLLVDKTINRRSEMGDIVGKMAGKIFKEYTVSNQDNYNENDAELLNNNYWFGLMMEQKSNSMTKNQDRILTQEMIDYIKIKSKINHVYYSFILENRIPRKPLSFIGMILLYPFIPITLPNYVNSAHLTGFYSFLINIDDGNIEYVDVRESKSRGLGGVLNSYYYNDFYTIHKTIKAIK